MENQPKEEIEVILSQGEFLNDADLKSVMYQYNPLALKDIHNIEKGVENFFKFNQSHFALFKKSALTSLQPQDIEFLKTKKILTTWEYLDFEDEKLVVIPVIIRPASLKQEQANKAVQSCNRGSVSAILQYIHHRDKKIQDLQSKNTLKDQVFKKFIQNEKNESIDFNDIKNLPELVKATFRFSFEFELSSQINISDELTGTLIGMLSKRNHELAETLAEFSDIPENAQNAMSSRPELPVLKKYTPDFHLIQTSLPEMVDMSGDNFRETNTETDYIFFIFVELARKILLSILPDEEAGWIEKSGVGQSERFYEELKKHSSFINSDEWGYSEEFLFIFKTLASDFNKLKEIRNDSRLDYAVTENLKHMNMKFELYNLNLQNFELDDLLLGLYNNNREKAFIAVTERIASNRSILYRHTKDNNFLASGMTMIFKENVPQAFIKMPGTRNLLHLISKQNGYNGGIYDFLIPVNKDDPKTIVDQQIALSKAISEWENEQEKERIKKENAGKPVFVRIIEFILSLFGFGISQSKTNSKIQQQDDKAEVEESKVSTSKPKSIGVIVGPKEKKMMVPVKVQKAVEYVERNNKGLIWIDEVLSAINSPQFSADTVSDMLYYDSKRRYLEIRALNNLKPVFIAREKENDTKWLKSTVDYLDNMAGNKKEYAVLSDVLKTRLG